MTRARLKAFETKLSAAIHEALDVFESETGVRVLSIETARRPDGIRHLSVRCADPEPIDVESKVVEEPS